MSGLCSQGLGVSICESVHILVSCFPFLGFTWCCKAGSDLFFPSFLVLVSSLGFAFGWESMYCLLWFPLNRVFLCVPLSSWRFSRQQRSIYYLLEVLACCYSFLVLVPYILLLLVILCWYFSLAACNVKSFLPFCAGWRNFWSISELVKLFVVVCNIYKKIRLFPLALVMQFASFMSYVWSLYWKVLSFYVSSWGQTCHVSMAMQCIFSMCGAAMFYAMFSSLRGEVISMYAM